MESAAKEKHVDEALLIELGERAATSLLEVKLEAEASETPAAPEVAAE